MYCDDAGLVSVLRLRQGGVTEHTLQGLEPRARLELQTQLGAGATEFAGSITPTPKKSLASSLHTRATLEEKAGVVPQVPLLHVGK